MSHLPDVLVSKVSAAISAAVEASAGVDVTMLPHVVRRGVMLAAHDAHVTLLPILERPKAVALGPFGGRWRRDDFALVDHVVGVVVRHVVIFSLAKNEAVLTLFFPYKIYFN